MKRYTVPLFGGVLAVYSTMDEHTGAFNRFAKLGGYQLNSLGALRDARGDSATAAFVVDNELTVLVHCAHRSAACHEAVHCAQAIAERVGMDPLKEQEAFAFTTQWCFDRITGVAA